MNSAYTYHVKLMALVSLIFNIWYYLMMRMMRRTYKNLITFFLSEALLLQYDKEKDIAIQSLEGKSED